MKVYILGTKYEILYREYNEDKIFAEKNFSAYCNEVEKYIVVCNHKTWPGLEDNSDNYCEELEKECLRHEIIHAFLYESGLSENAMSSNGSWATNEEMIDFFAMQFPKMLEVFRQVDAL